MKLSVIIPVYNEVRTIREIIIVVASVPTPKEIIVVDDGSTDGTRKILASLVVPGLRVIYQDRNQGKGSAIRRGIAEATGDAIIIQDADLEYDPMDYLPLLRALVSGSADVIYGSRFLGKKSVTAPWHRFVNFFLTELTNLLYGCRLTDMETCYKLYRTETLRSIPLHSNGFEIEVELTAKTLRSGRRIQELPISYKGRSFHDGKKIGWRDGVRAVRELVRYRFFAG